MTLTAVKSSTNWSPRDLQVLQRMKKNYAEMDERSGRPWRLGDDLLLVDPPSQSNINNGREARLVDAAQYVGCSANTLARYGATAAVWPPSRRREGVSYGIFQELAPDDDRFVVLDRLIKKYGAENLTRDIVRRSRGISPARALGSTERLQAFYTVLEKFPTTLKARDRLLAKQIINRLYVLLGEAEKEAV